METSERIDIKTSNGGDYYEVLFFDKDRKPCKKTDAKMFMIHEFMSDGTLIAETVAFAKESV